MNPVKAFVGHSFTADDDVVVRAFTEHLDTLKRLLSDFDWDHAVRPEPGLVDAKVLDLIRDKNVFIGICTKKEFVVSPTLLRHPLFWTNHYVGKVNAFQWKTSDWIIQEIGLAIGRGMRVILLVEEGVRLPGSLQGNLEYVPFNREAPEKCFGKLDSMIATLAGAKPHGDHLAEAEIPPQPRITATEKSKAEIATQVTQDTTDDLAVPNATWTLQQYEFAYMRSIDDREAAALIERQFEAAALSKSHSAKNHFVAWTQYLRILFGKGGSLADLAGSAQEATGEGAHEVLSFLAAAYESFGEHSRAAEAYEKAATLSEDVDFRIRMYGQAAVAYERAGQRELSIRAQNQSRETPRTETRHEITALQAVSELAETRNEENIYFGSMEALLSLQPENADFRFNLAYKYSNSGFKDLALFHYLKIPARDRSAVTWNNLGVAFDQARMPCKSVDAYRQANEKGETLAASNLGLKFLDAGFRKEAIEILEAGFSVPDHHKNVEKSLSRARELVDEEDQLQETTVKDTRPTSDDYRNFGSALTSSASIDLSGAWIGPRCTLAIKSSEVAFEASGEYEVQSALMLALAGHTPTSKKYFVTLRGRRFGNAIYGEVTTRAEDEAPKTILGSALDPSFIAWTSAEGNVVYVAQRSSPSSTPTRYELKRVAT